MTRFPDRIVRHHVDDQIFSTVIKKLVRLARLKKESVAGFNRCLTIFVTNKPASGNDVVKLPLRAVRVIRIGRLSGQHIVIIVYQTARTVAVKYRFS